VRCDGKKEAETDLHGLCLEEKTKSYLIDTLSIVKTTLKKKKEKEKREILPNV